MSVFNYLQLQPIDPQDDGTVSDFDQFDQDETLDLTQDVDGAALVAEWDQIEKDLHSDAKDSGK